MLNGALARRYAQALFEIAVEMSVLDRIDTELRDIAEIIDQNGEIGNVLNHPNISLQNKKELLENLFKGMGEITRSFLYLLVDRRRQNLVVYIQKEFTRLADEKRQVVEAKITSAAPLTPDQENKLKDIIVQSTGMQVRLLTDVDPGLIGGARLQISDRVMDGSIAAALMRMREELRKSSYKPQQEVGVS
ncbi:ATP synthase subunit delta [Syntrophobotulus glycolicus DSM 8271]|uniref:ATP synthase subunit delta n=1 Tax=Syntrophobotulus glycolicus (strain DSM 8271 / FlGlyR) TaxID=645991 RepID=F0T2A9_SYNGF|nr:F0F1 ATP synthase subunit delta [Syntrophobotulus glycolicus]ADY57537.1 ATP synthase subunit delta [Syntrophobotulus glycolicus DSM 8271]